MDEPGPEAASPDAPSSGAPGGDDSTAPRAAIPVDVWVLVAAALCVALGYGLVAPVLPQFATSFNVSATAATVVVSAFALFRLVFAPVGGTLIDRLGERWVYMSGLLIVAVSTLATGFAQSYWQLLLFRGLGGLGSTMFTISAAALMVRLAPAEARGRVSSYYASAFLLGNIGGPMLGGLLGSLGMRLPFFIYAGSLLAATAVVAMFLREGRARRVVEELPTMPLQEALEQRRYIGALLGAFANGWASFGMRVAVVPLFAAHLFDNGSGIAGFSLTAFAVGTAMVVLVAGRLADSLGRKPLIIVGFWATGAATLALGFADSIVLFVTLSALAGLGAGLINPAEQAVVADVIGKERSGGKVMATFQMAQDTGTIVGPIVAGVIVDNWGFVWAFAVSGVLCLAVGAWWLTIPEARVPARSTAAAKGRKARKEQVPGDGGRDGASRSWGDESRQGVDSDL